VLKSHENLQFWQIAQPLLYNPISGGSKKKGGKRREKKKGGRRSGGERL